MDFGSSVRAFGKPSLQTFQQQPQKEGQDPTSPSPYENESPQKIINHKSADQREADNLSFCGDSLNDVQQFPEANRTNETPKNESFSLNNSFENFNNEEDQIQSQQYQSQQDRIVKEFSASDNNIFANPFSSPSEVLFSNSAADRRQQGQFQREDSPLAFGSNFQEVVNDDKETIFQKLGIVKLENPVKKQNPDNGAVTFEKYENPQEKEEDELVPLQLPQQFQKLQFNEKVHNKSNLGNKISTRQGFAFQSVMKERATDSRQRFTIGHKTPLQRRMLLNKNTYDQTQTAKTPQASSKFGGNFNPFKNFDEGSPNPFNLNFHDQIRDRNSTVVDFDKEVFFGGDNLRGTSKYGMPVKNSTPPNQRKPNPTLQKTSKPQKIKLQPIEYTLNNNKKDNKNNIPKSKENSKPVKLSESWGYQ